MRSSYSKDEFLIAAARKKPRWQELIDNLKNMESSDIDILNEPLWVKDALRILKISKGIGQKERLKNFMLSVIEADRKAESAEQPHYQVRSWKVMTDLINGVNPHSITSVGWAIELCQNESFLIGPNNLIIIGADGMLIVSQDTLSILLSNSEFVNYMTWNSYRSYHQNELNKKF